MSELINAGHGGKDIRWRLMASVSAAVLIASIYASDATSADEDAERPTVWIELGGQLDRLSSPQAPFSPSFLANIPNTFFPPQNVEKPLQYAFGGEGSISFKPQESDWVFSAAVRFGRSNGIRQQHQQTQNANVPVHFTIKYEYRGGYSFYPYGHVKFEDAKAQRSEAHAVLDFQVGKDVGLGMFGSRGSSVLSAGIRIAQFTSKTNISLHAEPDVHYPSAPISSFAAKYAFEHYHVHLHDYTSMLNAQRSFKGIGPSVAWNGSAPFIGDPERGSIALDWGLNAAVLFGRQKVNGHHQTTTRSYSLYNFVSHPNARYGKIYPGYFAGKDGRLGPIAQHGNATDFNRARTVIVPNLGALAGLSFRYSNAKVSFGYRADFFFGAIDEGMDARETENVGFRGPFATISMGL